MSENSIRLTQYSHGAGCGCKISPKVLETILHSEQAKFVDPNLLVGNETRDDAAVYDLGNGTSVISTTDFFMPIVDNPFDFGRIAATNAISDIFAMGGKPIMAIAILGWPINKLSPEIAREVTEGGRYALLKPEHQGLATEVMCRMNIAGASFANIEGVKAMTDVTGFGLLGHLSEMCQGAGVQARVDYEAIPKLPGVEEYIKLGAVPGGTERNFASYGHLMGEMPREVRDLLCDPQTSGGLLLAVMPEAENEVKATAAEFGIELTAIGELVPARGGRAMVEIR